jgi:hypothetical protein
MSKKLFFLLPFLMFLAVAVVTPSCGDKCKEDKCANGQCDDIDGTCNCDPGYEYDADGSCTVLSQDKYKGLYDASEDCSSAPYTVEIIAGADLTKIQIKNFWDVFTNPVVATIEGNVVTIARQEPDGDKFFVEGSGTYTKNAAGKAVITLNYTVRDEDPVMSTGNKSCTATYTGR